MRDRGRTTRPHTECLRGVAGGGFLLVLLSLVLLLTGCKIEMGLDTKVEKDGSGTLGVRIAADKEILDLIQQQGGGEDFFGDFESQIPADWAIDRGTDADGTKWVTASKAFGDPSELHDLLTAASGGPGDAFAAQQFELSQERGFFGAKTIFQATWDVGAALSGVEQGAPGDLNPQALASIFEIQNRLTLPGSIKDNNATAVEGTTLIWRPSLSGVTEMYAQSVAYNWGTISLVAVVALLAVGAVVLAAVWLLRRRAARESAAALGSVPAAVGSAPSFPPQSPGQAPPGAEPPVPAPPELGGAETLPRTEGSGRTEDRGG